jgi:hypothetical protein
MLGFWRDAHSRPSVWTALVRIALGMKAEMASPATPESETCQKGDMLGLMTPWVSEE